jgi:hypothetical protein
MMVVTVAINGEIIDEIQVENKSVGHYQPGWYEWRSTKSAASGEVRHLASDGAMVLARIVLERRSLLQ